MLSIISLTPLLLVYSKICPKSGINQSIPIITSIMNSMHKTMINDNNFLFSRSFLYAVPKDMKVTIAIAKDLIKVGNHGISSKDYLRFPRMRSSMRNKLIKSKYKDSAPRIAPFRTTPASMPAGCVNAIFFNFCVSYAVSPTKTNTPI
jgi:hypothetical protein